MACDVKSLAAAAACFGCITDLKLFAAIQTQLLCNILDSISGGTGTVQCGLVNPTIDPGIPCCLYVNTALGTLWNWDPSGAGQWRGLITLS